MNRTRIDLGTQVKGKLSPEHIDLVALRKALGLDKIASRDNAEEDDAED